MTRDTTVVPKLDIAWQWVIEYPSCWTNRLSGNGVMQPRTSGIHLKRKQTNRLKRCMTVGHSGRSWLSVCRHQCPSSLTSTIWSWSTSGQLLDTTSGELTIVTTYKMVSYGGQECEAGGDDVPSLVVIFDQIKTHTCNSCNSVKFGVLVCLWWMFLCLGC